MSNNSKSIKAGDIIRFRSSGDHFDSVSIIMNNDGGQNNDDLTSVMVVSNGEWCFQHLIERGTNYVNIIVEGNVNYFSGIKKLRSIRNEFNEKQTKPKVF